MRRLKNVILGALMIVTLSATTQAVKEYQARKLNGALRELAAGGFQGTQATQFDECVISHYLPDPECTPGAVFPFATREMICTRGYARSARNVSQATKETAYRIYGITHHPRGAYEVDHFISLQLGGSNDLSNLWPESATGIMNSHEKDKVENFLHDELCAGRLSVPEVQQLVSWKWKETYDLIH